MAHGQGAGGKFQHQHVARHLGPQGRPPALVTQIHDIVKNAWPTRTSRRNAKSSAWAEIYGPQDLGKFMVSEDARYSSYYGRKLGDRYKK